MISKEKINRINELSKKRKTEGLTEAEAEERKALHAEYVAAVRENLRAQLDTIKVVDPEDNPENWTPEQRENAAYLSEKLGKELAAQNARDDQLRTTLAGNPSCPQGEAGMKMVARMNASHKNLTDWGLDFYHGSPKTILDIGCGGGAALDNLHRRFPDATIYGIDISEVSVETALAFNRQGVIDDKIRVTQGSVSALPYGENFFDLVISVESYFFWPEIEDDIKEIARVLKPEGSLLTIAEMYKGGDFTKTEEKLRDTFELKLLAPEDFKALYESAGLTDIEIHTEADSNWICAQAKKA